MASEQPKNPLHGITLKAIVSDLVERRGYEDLAARIDIRCFQVNPSINSTLKFLRKTPWARQKVERLYLRDQRELSERPTPGPSRSVPLNDPNDLVQRFLAAPEFAVVGASTHREKYGNKVLRCFVQHGRPVTPINPRATEIEGLPCAASLAALARPQASVSIITPPAITLAVVEEAAATGHTRLWMQPGAESRESVERARELGLELIHSGPCVLVVLGYRE